MKVTFCAVLFFLRDALDEILNLIESVSEGLPTCSYRKVLEFQIILKLQILFRVNE